MHEKTHGIAELTGSQFGGSAEKCRQNSLLLHGNYYANYWHNDGSEVTLELSLPETFCLGAFAFKTPNDKQGIGYKLDPTS